mgnify:CR=1 FL=1
MLIEEERLGFVDRPAAEEMPPEEEAVVELLSVRSRVVAEERGTAGAAIFEVDEELVDDAGAEDPAGERGVINDDTLARGVVVFVRGAAAAAALGLDSTLVLRYALLLVFPAEGP